MYIEKCEPLVCAHELTKVIEQIEELQKTACPEENILLARVISEYKERISYLMTQAGRLSQEDAALEREELLLV